MHKLFTEGTRGEARRETEVGPIPKSWRAAPLGEFLELTQYGLSVRGTEKGSRAMLRMTNQVDGRIVPHDMQRIEIDDDNFTRFKVERGDLLFNRTNSFELVGRTAIFDIEGDCVFASYLIRLRTKPALLNPFFLNHYFNWNATQHRLKTIASRAVSQSNISATRLKAFPVPVPARVEQAEIVSALDVVDRTLAVDRRRAATVKALFRTLLHKLMTAEIGVDDLDLAVLA